jgi:anti-sigma B factor antagonist
MQERDTSDRHPPRRSAGRVTPGASQHFVAATEQLDDGRPVVSVMGEVDLATASAFAQTLLGVAEERKGEVIVDLTDCSFFDSTGLSALLAARERLERSNRSLALVLGNPTVRKVFQITGFDERFEIYPSLGAAAGRGANAAGNGNGHV